MEGRVRAATAPSLSWGAALPLRGSLFRLQRAVGAVMERRIRLRRASDVQRVYAEGRSWAHPLLVLVARPNELGFSRVGVTASRGVGGAVDRNRAKRLLREAARHLYPEFESRGWDMMLIARPEIVDAKEMRVEEALASLLRRAESSLRADRGVRTGDKEE